MNWILLTDAKNIKNDGRHGSTVHTFHGGDDQSFFRFHSYIPGRIVSICGLSSLDGDENIDELGFTSSKKHRKY